jgi:hypothetical protein
MRKIRSRTSLRVGLLPGCLVILETSLQYRRKPARCQRTTVSGVTMRRDCFQPDQTRRATTQKTRSRVLRLGRGRRRFRTESCWRKAKFSRRRLRCERKRRTIVPRKSLTNRSMARSYTRTAGETPAARLLISLSAGVLANHRSQIESRRLFTALNDVDSKPAPFAKTAKDAAPKFVSVLSVSATRPYTLIGGTAIGTVLTLIFLPALYSIWFGVKPTAAASDKAKAGLVRP